MIQDSGSQQGLAKVDIWVGRWQQQMLQFVARSCMEYSLVFRLTTLGRLMCKVRRRLRVLDKSSAVLIVAVNAWPLYKVESC